MVRLLVLAEEITYDRLGDVDGFDVVGAFEGDLDGAREGDFDGELVEGDLEGRADVGDDEGE